MTLGRSPAVSEPVSQASPKTASRSREPVGAPGASPDGLQEAKAWWPLQVSLWGRAAAAAAGVARWREASSASRSGRLWPEAAQLMGADPEGALPLAGSLSGPRLGRLRCDFRGVWVSAGLKRPFRSRWALGKLCKGKPRAPGLSLPPYTPTRSSADSGTCRCSDWEGGRTRGCGDHVWMLRRFPHLRPLPT